MVRPEVKRSRKSESAVVSAAFRRLSVFLSMDFGVVVLFRFNLDTRRYTCIWGDMPVPEDMEGQAQKYVGKINGLNLAGVEWVNSDVLLNAVNRPKMHRPLPDDYR